VANRSRTIVPRIVAGLLGLTGVGLLVAVAGVPVPAAAQDFFRASPGPLTRGHADLEGIRRCLDCHTAAEGIDDQKCLGCHTHQPLADRIRRGEGLHAELVRNKGCADCHIDHKGRDHSLIDWSTVGGRDTFDHRRAGYELQGRHATIACADCHTATMPISGTRTYLGLSQSCMSCHENVHRFEPHQTALLACESCHTEDARRIDWRRDRPPFDHDTDTEYPLSVPHRDVGCTDCHSGLVFKFQTRDWQQCSSCHTDPHRNHFSRDMGCTSCHLPDSPRFTRTRFDHERDTGWALTGAHLRQSCATCHPGGLMQKPQPTCQSCHGDPHQTRFDAFGCTDCHDPAAPEAFRSKLFRHGNQTEFALTGMHADIACKDCHRIEEPRRPFASFERLEWTDRCMDCHTHQNAHDGQFDDMTCTNCHNEGGSRDLVFDHDRDSIFPLVGFHGGLACDTCHIEGVYKGLPLNCAGCHADAHAGQLGENCESCHSPDHRFETHALFDHDTQSRFPLEGRHANVDCAKCHFQEEVAVASEPMTVVRFKPMDSECQTCHLEDDAHFGTLGQNCGRCHVTEGFEVASRDFDHLASTGFPLTGSHAPLDCESCHPPVPGSEPERRRLFQFAGGRCVDCHGDPHQVGPTLGTWCSTCHTDESFEGGDFAGAHGSGTVQLGGIHERLDCSQCHTPTTVRTGEAMRCVTCHFEDDVHTGSLGPHCGDCHLQESFTPSTFQHLTTGFQLLGRHRMVACVDCHTGGNFGALNPTCMGCHQLDYMQADDPPHYVEPIGPLYPLTCEQCHTEWGWRPALELP
jgi:hypothetical protein